MNFSNLELMVQAFSPLCTAMGYLISYFELEFIRQPIYWKLPPSTNFVIACRCRQLKPFIIFLLKKWNILLFCKCVISINLVTCHHFYFYQSPNFKVYSKQSVQTKWCFCIHFIMLLMTLYFWVSQPKTFLQNASLSKVEKRNENWK